MTMPRRILPGRTWFITRRTTRRFFLLRPDADGTAQSIYWYVTAVLAAKFGILIHATQVMSTHIHEVLTDTRGNLPDFLRERNRALANALKAHRGWPEEVFQRAPASCVELFGARAILQQIGYTIANCVEAGLVRSPEDWPGVRTVADDIGSSVIHVERPVVYFDPNNPVWPARASIKIAMPPELHGTYGERARDVLVSFVNAAIAAAREVARAAGRFVGRVERLVRIPIHKRARGYEPFGSRNPTFAAGGDPAQFARATSERSAFLGAYRRALELWKAASATPAFPEGTWRWCRELLGQRSTKIFQCRSDLDLALGVAVEPGAIPGSRPCGFCLDPTP